MERATRNEDYRGWNIELRPHEEYCSRFAMTLTSPEGKSKHINAAGDTEAKALARAHEIVDLERDHFDK